MQEHGGAAVGPDVDVHGRGFLFRRLGVLFFGGRGGGGVEDGPDKGDGGRGVAAGGLDGEEVVAVAFDEDDGGLRVERLVGRHVFGDVRVAGAHPRAEDYELWLLLLWWCGVCRGGGIGGGGGARGGSR